MYSTSSKRMGRSPGAARAVERAAKENAPAGTEFTSAVAAFDCQLTGL